MTADQKGAIIIRDDDAMFIPFVFILSINMENCTFCTSFDHKHEPLDKLIIIIIIIIIITIIYNMILLIYIFLFLFDSPL